MENEKKKSNDEFRRIRTTVPISTLVKYFVRFSDKRETEQCSIMSAAVIDNNILIKAAERAVISSALSLSKGDDDMVTYSDIFTFVIMICAIITLVRNDKDRK